MRNRTYQVKATCEDPDCTLTAVQLKGNREVALVRCLSEWTQSQKYTQIVAPFKVLVIPLTLGPASPIFDPNQGVREQVMYLEPPPRRQASPEMRITILPVLDRVAGVVFSAIAIVLFSAMTSMGVVARLLLSVIVIAIDLRVTNTLGESVMMSREVPHGSGVNTPPRQEAVDMDRLGPLAMVVVLAHHHIGVGAATVGAATVAARLLHTAVVAPTPPHIVQAGDINLLWCNELIL